MGFSLECARRQALCEFPVAAVTSPQNWWLQFSSVQFSSVAQLCPTLCDPMDCSTPGLPVPHQLPEFTQAHVHWWLKVSQFYYLLALETRNLK